MFGFIVAPMIFFGCAYYPWKALDAAPVVQVLVLINPLVYVSEGMRGALTPSLPHMSPLVVAGALVVLCGLFLALGLRAFDRRAVT
jgi:ABC-2 type transport system permease protein